MTIITVNGRRHAVAAAYATGVRLRSVPFAPERVKAVLA